MMNRERTRNNEKAVPTAQPSRAQIRTERQTKVKAVLEKIPNASAKQIATALGLKLDVVYRILRELRPVKNAALTEQIIAMKCRNPQISTRAIAAETGSSQSTISRINKLLPMN
jgi:DNA invertase Pin-like site-specific DNA recombinase